MAMPTRELFSCCNEVDICNLSTMPGEPGRYRERGAWLWDRRFSVLAAKCWSTRVSTNLSRYSSWRMRCDLWPGHITFHALLNLRGGIGVYKQNARNLAKRKKCVFQLNHEIQQADQESGNHQQISQSRAAPSARANRDEIRRRGMARNR